MLGLLYDTIAGSLCKKGYRLLLACQLQRKFVYFTMSLCFLARTQPARCCQSNTDTDTPLQPAEMKRSISANTFFIPFHNNNNNNKQLTIHLKTLGYYFLLYNGLTKCDASWTNIFLEKEL